MYDSHQPRLMLMLEHRFYRRNAADKLLTSHFTYQSMRALTAFEFVGRNVTHSGLTASEMLLK